MKDDDIEKLMQFYDVKNLNQLVEEQAAHIERLQAKLAEEKPIPDNAFKPIKPRFA